MNFVNIGPKLSNEINDNDTYYNEYLGDPCEKQFS